MGRALCAKMKELLARQQADVAVQAAANNRIVARETIKACCPTYTCLFSPLLIPRGGHRPMSNPRTCRQAMIGFVTAAAW